MSDSSIKYNVVSVETTTKTTTTTQTEIKTQLGAELQQQGTEPQTSTEPQVTNQLPPYLYVLSDNVGYVGTYYSISDIEEITSAYHLVTFIVQCFKTSKTSDLLKVWVVLYKDIDAVAFVSNNREDALKVQSTLMQVGITYIDSIDCWKQNIGLSKSAKDRLDAIHSIKTLKLLDDSYNIFIKKIDLSTEDSKIYDINTTATKIINIMDSIIPSIIKNENADGNEEADGNRDGNEADDNGDGNEADDNGDGNRDGNKADGNGDGNEDGDGNENGDDNEEADGNKGAENGDDNEGAENGDGNEDEENKEAENGDDNEAERKDKEVIFCEKCQNLVSTIYNEPNIDEEKFNKSLILFVANHCYNCFCAIRYKYRKNKIELLQKNINIPIDSPYICTNKDNIPKIDDTLKKAMGDLDNILNISKNVKDLDIEQALSINKKNDEDEDDVEDVEMP
uniref:Uncharacterized protein n=1 Tax=viral metagenome TaxID=1070528 RepID=A0A6C0I049_9ZZZZ